MNMTVQIENQRRLAPLFVPPQFNEVKVKMTQSVEIDWWGENNQNELLEQIEMDALLDKLCEKYGIFDKINKRSKTSRGAV